MIRAPFFQKKHSRDEKSFSRTKKISFLQLIAFILRTTKKSIQVSLIESFGEDGLAAIPTKSALSQRRQQFKHTAFIELNEFLVHDLYTRETLPTWNGYRLLAIDGSALNLPNAPDIVEEFGRTVNQRPRLYAMAKIAACYDVLSHITIAAAMKSYNTSEYELARLLIESMKSPNDLFLFDRGFGAQWFFFFLLQCNKQFVIRLTTTTFADFTKSSVCSEIRHINSLSHDARKTFRKQGLEFKPFTIRLIKVPLDSGVTEILATSLIDSDQYPDEVFKGLYAKRWGIETAYDHLKNHLEVENFSGRSVELIKQDFFANVFLENIRVMIELDVNDDLAKNEKNCTYVYKVNRNVSLGVLADRVWDLCCQKRLNRGKQYELLKKLFAIQKVPIIPDRHNPRDINPTEPKKRYHPNQRRSL